MTSQQPSALKYALIEFGAVILWVSCSLFVFVITASTLVHSIAPSLKEFPPTQIFLTALVGVMAFWEILGLSFGGLINPAITLSLLVAGDISIANASQIILPQFLGHVIGVFVVRSVIRYLFSSSYDTFLSPPKPHDEISNGVAIAVEAFLTGLFCLVALSLKHLLPQSAKVKKWVIITATVVFTIAVGGEWTGSCMNPAMSFALSITDQKWSAHGVYWLGPFLGAVVAGLLHNALFLRRTASLPRKVRRKIAMVQTVDPKKTI